MDKPFSVWIAFFIIVIFLLVFDLGLLHRKEREIGIKESLWLSLFYILVSLGFGGIIYYCIGTQEAKDFLTGYVIEKSLSMDNIFAISMVFNYFYIPRRYQYRVLFWGILGVVLLRGIMIALGAALIQEFEFVLYMLGAFLVFTGAKIFFAKDHGDQSLERNKIMIWLKKHVPVTASLHGSKFFVYEKDTKNSGNVLRKMTPLFLVLVFIELADVIFAIDSVPAVFAVTTDTFVVYTSNIFAILGLRALYFALAAMIHRFSYLKYALALVLVFIGGKILAAPVLGKLPSVISLAVTLALLLGGILVSLYKTRATKS